MSFELSESLATIVQRALAQDLLVSIELPPDDSFWASANGVAVARACPFSWQVHLCAFGFNFAPQQLRRLRFLEPPLLMQVRLG